MPTKLEEILPILYKDMHAAGAFLGDTWRRHLPRFRQFLADRPEAYPILDFGCGPSGGIAAEYKPGRVVSYDPYVPAYAADPWASHPRTFFSCDVFEHMTVDQLRKTVHRMADCPTLSQAFVALSTRAANKIMPNGMNAHLTVRSADWWQGFFEARLGIHFDCVGVEADLLRNDCVFLLTRKANA